MVTNILYTTILSLVIIILLHHFFIYFKQNLTTPKIKDLVNQPIKQYNEIYDIINTDKPVINVTNKTAITNTTLTGERVCFQLTFIDIPIHNFFLFH